MQRLAAMVSVAFILTLTAMNAQADSRALNAKCSLKIDGATYMNSQCHFSSTADTDSFDDLKLVIVCPNGRNVASTNCYGYEQRVTRNGVFGYLFREEGVARFCWNGESQRKAQDCYEGLRRTGACWANARAPSSHGAKQTSNIELCAWRL